jgi:acetylornithine deacetylase/succinyl-diaminopimelate desuccinylase-like protein
LNNSKKHFSDFSDSFHPHGRHEVSSLEYSLLLSDFSGNLYLLDVLPFVPTLSIIMFNTYLSLLREYIAITSISTDPAYHASILECASWLHTLFIKHGFESQIITWYGNPVVLAHYELPLLASETRGWERVGVRAETCLIYGHYDVQPADISEWRAQSPRDIQLTEDKLIARGAIDNKGQLMIHLATIIDLIDRWELAYNITFLIEWDEETGWWNMSQLIKDHEQLLEADLCLVSDGEMIGRSQPVIETGFRGWANMTLQLQTATTDAHSGIYGWILPNASHELSKLISKMHDHDSQTLPLPLGEGWGECWSPLIRGCVGTTEGFEKILENNKKLLNVDAEILASTGAKMLLKPTHLDSYTVTGNLPTIQVTGIESGYMWVWYRNAVPSTASCKINCRFVEWQDPAEMVKLIETRISEHISDYVDYTINWSDAREATVINTDNHWISHTKTILEQVFQTSVPYKYCGWSLPIIWLLQELWLTCVMVPLANQDCLMHGVGENFALKTCEKWLEFSRRFFSIPA